MKYHNRYFSSEHCLYLDQHVHKGNFDDELAGIKRAIYQRQHLSGYFRKENRYILFLGLGGTTGSSIIIEILEYLRSNQIAYDCYCFYPYSFEPSSRIRIAQETLDRLSNYQNTHILRMDEIKERYPNLNLASVFRLPNEFLVENYLQVNL